MAKYLRYEHNGKVSFGRLVNETTIEPLEGEFANFRSAGGLSLNLEDVKLLAPTQPTKIVAAGPGYRAPFGDAEPMPMMFWQKPVTCLNHPEGIIELPPGVPAVNHEVEFAIVIGKRAKQVKRADAEDYIFGYTCMNDVTAGDFSTPEAFGQSPYFVYGKTFDGFAPIGPWIETELDTGNLHLECRVNGEVRQSHSTSDRLYSPAEVVEMVSNILTLVPGDVISTGSPPGVQPIVDGDVVEIEIEKIGTLRNYARNRE